MAFADKEFDGGDNVGGLLGGVVYATKKSNIDSTAVPDLAAAGGETITGNIALIANAKFFKLGYTIESGKVDYNTIGDMKGKKKENILEFFQPEDDVQISINEREMLNTEYVVIYKNSNGTQRCMGLQNRDVSAVTLHVVGCHVQDAAGSTATEVDGRQGTVYQMREVSPSRPLFYPGTIDLDAGS
jgi:hypothetical protein